MKTSIRHIFSLGVKEIIELWRDPLLICLIIFSFTFSIYTGAKSTPDAIEHAPIAIVDEDNSPLTKRISDAFIPPLFLKPVKISRSEMDAGLDAGVYTFVVVFEPDFQEHVLANHLPEVQLNVDATRMSQAFSGTRYVQQIIKKEIRDFMHEYNPESAECSASHIVRSRFNPNIIKSWEGAVNAFVNSIAMIALILTGSALIRERESGTLEHLMVLPLNATEIMISKIWSMSLVVICASAFSLYAVINYMLEVPIAGSVPLFILGLILCLFVMTSMGILFACCSQDMPQFGILMILVLMPMQILSGGKTPQANMPEFVQIIMQAAPTTHLVNLTKAIIFRGAEFSLIWPVFLKMLILGTVCFIISLKRFRKWLAN